MTDMDINAHGMSRLDVFDHSAVGLALGLIGTSGLLLALADTGLPVPRAAFAVLWLALWGVVLVAVLVQPLAIARRGSWHQWWPLAVTLLLFIYAAIRLGSSSFAIDDELTSWNYWAIQHFLSVPADYAYTQAAYPQLFAEWVGSVYRVLGSFDQQAVARVTVSLTTVMLGLLMMRACALAGRYGSWLAALLLLVLWFSGFRLSFTRGLADPLMVVALLASVHYFLEYAAESKRPSAFWWCALTAVVASYTKQPALIWSCVVLPVLCAWCVWRRGWKPWTLGLALLSAGGSVVWPLVIGRGFQNNQGVISRSLGGREWLQQLAHSAHSYLLDRPQILLVFAVSIITCWSKPLLRGLWLLLLLPMLLAWFIWGAYAFRLGMHVVGLAGLLLLHACNKKSVPSDSRRTWSWSSPAVRLAYGAQAAMLAVLLVTTFGALAMAAKRKLDLGQGADVTIRHYFEASADTVLAIYRGKQPVWVSSNYLNGIFYGNNPVIVPLYTSDGYSRQRMLRELMDSGAAYAFSAGKVPYGQASAVLLQTAAACPRVFREIVHGRNAFGYKIFKLDIPLLWTGACQP